MIDEICGTCKLYRENDNDIDGVCTNRGSFYYRMEMDKEEGCDNWNGIKELVKLRENQAKYEKALEVAAGYINDCDYCPVKECGGATSGIDIDECEKQIISAWKRKAGFEVER